MRKIIEKIFNDLVSKTIDDQEKKHGSEVQLILQEKPLVIKILKNYSPVGQMKVDDMGLPKMVKASTVEKNIVKAIEYLAKRFNAEYIPRIIIAKKSGSIICYFYDGKKPINIININDMI